MSTIKSTTTQLELSGGVDCILCYPGDDPSQNPGVLQLTDVGGIRPATISLAETLAAGGFTVLMPNLFHRTSRPPVMGDAQGLEARMARMRELTALLVPELVAEDLKGYIDFLCARAKPGPVAAVGYCYSGGLALRAAAVRPDMVHAAASFHGSGLYVEGDPNSPHLLLPKVKARLYFGHASKDPFMPEAAIEALQQALTVWGGVYESEVYEGAFHSWTAPDSPVYSAAQAARAFAKLSGQLNEFRRL